MILHTKNREVKTTSPPVAIAGRLARGLLGLLETILASMLLGEYIENPSQQEYHQLLDKAERSIAGFSSIFAALVDDTGAPFVKERILVKRLGEHSKLCALLALHRLESTQIGGQCTAIGAGGGGDSQAELGHSDLLRVLSMRKSFDGGAREYLDDVGLSHDLLPPAAHHLDINETVHGTFVCWSPMRGSLHVTTGHLLFEPQLWKEENRKKIALQDIQFLKKQKMTLLGSDTCLEVAKRSDDDNAADIELFRGFANVSDRDRCHDTICTAARSESGGRVILDSAEGGEWPELRKMFSLPSSETMQHSWTCSFVQRGPQNVVHPNGVLYLTTGFLCYHSYFFGARHQDVIRLSEIQAVEKASYPALIPNAIDVFTKNSGRRLSYFGFGYALDRNRAFHEVLTAFKMNSAADASSAAQHGGDEVTYAITVMWTHNTLAHSAQLCCLLVGETGSSGVRETTLAPSTAQQDLHEFTVQCNGLGKLRSCRIWFLQREKSWLQSIAGGSDASAVLISRVVVGAISDVDRADPASTVHFRIERQCFVGGAALERDADTPAQAFTAVASATNMRLAVTESVYENQRKPVLGSTFSAQALLRTERPAWSNEGGTRLVQKHTVSARCRRRCCCASTSFDRDSPIEVVEKECTVFYINQSPGSRQPAALLALGGGLGRRDRGGCDGPGRLGLRLQLATGGLRARAEPGRERRRGPVRAAAAVDAHADTADRGREAARAGAVGGGPADDRARRVRKPAGRVPRRARRRGRGGVGGGR
jgi:hypothetical protein